jgi:geranylgeranyl reductase family protein
VLKTSKVYDVAIIGAGPAGSSLAYRLARSGLEPIVLDKERFPRKKVCAGGLTAKVLEVLPFEVSPVIEDTVARINMSYQLAAEFAKTYHRPLIYTVDRGKFDAFLLRRAREAGAAWVEGARVEGVEFSESACTVLAGRGRVQARVAVGADGALSAVARSLNLKPADWHHLGLHAEIPGESLKKDIIDYPGAIYLDWGSMPSGYGWIFPRGNGVGAGAAGLNGPGTPGKAIKSYCARMLARRLGLKPEEVKLSAHLIPHRVRERPITRDRALLVGDAAGLTDFWTGEGIYWALKSSEIAARHIRKFLDGDRGGLKAYEQEVNRTIMPELKTACLFSRVFDILGGLIHRSLKHGDYPWEVFCRVMRGDRTFCQVKRHFRPDILLKKLCFKPARSVPH